MSVYLHTSELFPPVTKLTAEILSKLRASNKLNENNNTGAPWKLVPGQNNVYRIFGDGINRVNV